MNRILLVAIPLALCGASYLLFPFTSVSSNVSLRGFIRVTRLTGGIALGKAILEFARWKMQQGSGHSAALEIRLHNMSTLMSGIILGMLFASIASGECLSCYRHWKSAKSET